MDLFGNHEVQDPADSNKREETNLPQMPLSFKNISNTDHNYQLVDNEEKRSSLVRLLNDHSFFCFDTETTGLDANNCELVGLSFSVKQGEAWYVPLPADQDECRTIVTEFKSVLENPLISKIGQNIKYDILVLKWYDVNIQGELFDTMLAHYLIDPDSRHNMDLLAENYLNYSPVSISTLIGDKGKNQGNMRDADIEKVKEYAAEDADITLQLKTVFEPILKSVNAWKLAEDIENPLIYVLADIEHEGVKIDQERMTFIRISPSGDVHSVA